MCVRVCPLCMLYVCGRRVRPDEYKRNVQCLVRRLVWKLSRGKKQTIIRTIAGGRSALTHMRLAKMSIV